MNRRTKREGRDAHDESFSDLYYRELRGGDGAESGWGMAPCGEGWRHANCRISAAALSGGAIPLDILDARINRWIKVQLAVVAN